MTTIPTQAQYEQNEADKFNKQMMGYERAPLADRQEGRKDFLAMMQDSPAVIGERIGWLLAGNYGFGAMQAAKAIASASDWLNKGASLCLMIGSLDCGCPASFGRQAWKGLSIEQRVILAKAVSKALEAFKANKES